MILFLLKNPHCARNPFLAHPLGRSPAATLDVRDCRLGKPIVAKEYLQYFTSLYTSYFS